MGLANKIIDNIVSISSFGRGEAAKNFEKAKESPVVVVKNNVPEAVIIDIAEFKRLTTVAEDYDLLVESLRRLESSEGTSLSQSEIMKKFGITETDLDELDDVEFE